MTFTTVNLTGERVLVKGTDRFNTEGQTVLDAAEWNEAKRRSAFVSATEDFDAAVEEFFKPVTEAADKLAEITAGKDEDKDSYIVLHEGTEAVHGQDEIRMRLSHDSIVLRLIERGDHDRLVWVLDSLEVLAPAETPDPTVTDEGWSSETGSDGVPEQREG